MLKEYFARREYRKKTARFFNPDLNIDVFREQFLQILSGEMVNPDRLVSPKTRTDYSFMIVGVPTSSPLNSWAGKKWGLEGYFRAQMYSDWYAKICCENDLHVVFPKQNLVFYFDPNSEYIRGKNFSSAGELELALFDGRASTCSERDLKVLISDLNAGEVLKYLRDYKRRFTAI